MLYIMFGADDYSLRKELSDIKSRFGNPEMLDLNTSILDGRQVTLNTLCDSCSAMPFMHTARLVIVEGLLDRFNPEKKTGKTGSKGPLKSRSDLKEWQQLGDFIEKMPPSTTLILIEREVNTQKNSLFARISSFAKICTFPPLKKDALKIWIKKRVAESGGNFSPAAIELLEKLIGGDLWHLTNEIEKLIVYCNGRVATEDDVKQVTSYTREENIFALVDSILDCKRKDAQQLLYRLLNAGEAPPYILNMINRQLRLILMIKELKPDTKDQQIMEKLAIYQEWRFNILVRQSKSHSFERIKEAYGCILETDLAIKTGKSDGDLALDLLVADLCRN
jgi:DNA polymerase-3 subunit delta